MAAELPDRAQAVVIGGGVIGTSVAYHLTKLGVTDVVLVEQGQLSSGTTWHAAGLVGQLRASESLTRLVQYSTQLYAELENETGLSAGYKQCGGVTVARTEDRMTQLRRTAASAAAFNMECELLSPEQALEHYPVMRVDDLVGAIWLPADGKANPTDLTFALAKGARMRGARIVEKTRVIGHSHPRGPRCRGEHRQGRRRGGDRRQLRRAVGETGRLDGGSERATSFGRTLLCGDRGHRRRAPRFADPARPRRLHLLQGGSRWSGHRRIRAGSQAVGITRRHPISVRIPTAGGGLGSLRDPDEQRLVADPRARGAPGIKKLYNGPESFTPDNQFILGEAPGLANYFVGAGFNSVGIATAGGAGRALAEWIVNGAPTGDLTGVDIRRFAPFNGNTRWLHDRVAEVLGLHYEIPWPNREMKTARPFRRSPVHHLLEAANANFGSRMGWERANFFAPAEAEPTIEYTWGKPNWLAWSAAEQTNTRTAVTVFDQTSFSKYLMVGPDSEAALQWLCTADVGAEIGRAVYTGMLNERGTYESDVTVTRTGVDEFFIVSSAATTERDKDHIRRSMPADARASLVDVTSAYAVFGVMGPSSRDLLSTLTDADLSDAAFPFGTSQLISLGYATVRATRITYVGELGWELYVPAEFAVGVYEDLMAAGEALGVGRGGYYTIESMRLEKGYRAFGRELTPSENPVEAGLLFACKLKTDIGFLGREAVEKAKAEGARRKLVGFSVDDPAAMLWGGELILRDGAVAGQVTSAAWGETVGACVGLAYVRAADKSVINADWVKAGSYQVNVGGLLYPISASLRPIYDPTSAKIRP